MALQGDQWRVSEPIPHVDREGVAPALTTAAVVACGQHRRRAEGGHACWPANVISNWHGPGVGYGVLEPRRERTVDGTRSRRTYGTFSISREPRWAAMMQKAGIPSAVNRRARAGGFDDEKPGQIHASTATSRCGLRACLYKGASRVPAVRRDMERRRERHYRGGRDGRSPPRCQVRPTCGRRRTAAIRPVMAGGTLASAHR